jgi:predicted  nucleic acid-binding Zn-ribbon protein
MSTVDVATEAPIDRLATLQGLDRDLKAKRERIAALVAEAEDCEARLRDERAAVARLGAEHASLEAQRVDLEAQVEVQGSRIRDSRMRMNRVRTEAEILALQRQVEIGREANQQLEEQLLGVMESLETIDAQLVAARANVQELEAKAESDAAERRQQAENLSRELAAERARRDLVAEGIDPRLRDKYEQLFEHRGGSAVVEVRHGTCLGCHMNVPPQLFNEVQRYRDVRQCPNCHRILYWRPTG